MNFNFIKSPYEFFKFQTKKILPQTDTVFQALADAIISKTPELGDKQKSILSFGAVDSHIDEYIIWSLEHYLSLIIVKLGYNVHLANVTAELLNIAAKQLIDTGGNKKPINPAKLSEESAFAALAPSDRFRAINLLEQLEVNRLSLPIPFNIIPNLVLNSTASVALLSIIGYYTEWSGYGSTRMAAPEKRKLEHFPIGWTQVGYPGPVKGYHAFRGYLVDKFSE